MALYSITSYVELARDAERAEQAGTADAEPAWLDTIFPETNVPTVAATDYVRALPRMSRELDNRAVYGSGHRWFWDE